MIKDVLSPLNLIQEEAVHSTEGPLLILAGAGSGKTACMTHRVAYLIKEKLVSPEHILCITFTNKAANEMKERIIKLVGKAPPFTGTFHSLCAKILRKYGHHIGIDPHFVIYDQTDQIEAVKKAMDDLGISKKQVSPRSALVSISSAKNELITEKEYPQYVRGVFQETVARIYLQYTKILQKNRALDFDDLLSQTVFLFQKHKEVLDTYATQFQYILVDEYQDTNHAQYLLTKLLASRWKNIAVCGDDDQSIYAFRGADIKNILDFEKDYPNCKVLKLEQNYRSTKTILEAAYMVIRQNRNRKEKRLWTQNSQGNPIRLFQGQNEIDEANFITQTVLSTQLPLSSYAVLYRTNAQSRTIEESLLKTGLPYILVGGTKFYERKEVKDVLSYLRLLLNPSDRLSEERVLKIGKSRFNQFLELQKNINVDTCSALEALDRILSSTEYLSLLENGTEEGETRIENVKELRSVASQFTSLVSFLENVSLVEQEYLPEHPSNGEKKEAIQLMTLHAAKGLEFPIVFMIGMEEGLFPHSRSLLDPNELEEERRLCYVGLTRSKEDLYLTYARNRLYFGSRMTSMLSRFVEDIPKEFIATIET
ncbi:MAG TPA: UvrD-helicase domain-containing protein [Patescibacteria group bacterium]|nr:UvrD-helicase domain-containing protein [Patescibacteria group bacterium]